MGSTKCLGVLLFCLLSTASCQQQGGCIAELVQNEDFMRCSQSLSTLMQEAQTSGKMVAVFCSPEGKAGLKCLSSFIFECPEMEQALQMGGGGLNLKEMMKQGGIDVLCELSTSENCRPKLEACSSKMNGTAMGPGMGDGMMPGMGGAGTPPPGMGAVMGMGGSYQPATPYNMMPMQMTMLCGPMNETLTCIQDAMNECPKTAQYMEEVLEKMYTMQQEEGGLIMPSYAESKKYIIESCPGLPNDFQAKQMRIAGSMAKQEFQECYKNVTESKEKNCGVYFGGKKCVMTYVGADCGDAYASAIAIASPLFSDDIPSGCEKQTGGVSRGGVSSLQASVLTLIGATTLLLVGRY